MGLVGEQGRLARVVGVPGAVLMGLGSILGTGIFVSIGLAAEVAGPSVILAVAMAAVVATFNGLSSAQLAASHPVSGGTYEYGYRYGRARRHSYDSRAVKPSIHRYSPLSLPARFASCLQWSALLSR